MTYGVNYFSSLKVKLSVYVGEVRSALVVFIEIYSQSGAVLGMMSILTGPLLTPCSALAVPGISY